MGARNLGDPAASGGLLRADPAARAGAAGLLERITRFHGRGWCDATSGNFSVVLSRHPIRLLITRSGFDKGRARADDFLIVDEDGRSVDDGPEQPSAETLLHAAIVRSAGAGAVFHTHSVWGTLLGERFAGDGGFTIRGYEMLKAFEGVVSHRAAVRIPVVDNSQNVRDLATEVEKRVLETATVPGFLIAGHGLYAWGRSLDDATRHLEALEFLFGVVGRRVPMEPFAGQET